MYICIVLSMMTKYVLGLVTVCTVKLMQLKMQYVQEQKTPDQWQAVKTKVYRVMFSTIAFTTLLTAVCATRIALFLGQ